MVRSSNNLKAEKPKVLNWYMSGFHAQNELYFPEIALTGLFSRRTELSPFVVSGGVGCVMETCASKIADLKPTEPTKSNTCCVVVTHHPDKAFSSRVQAIAGQVDALVMVDNGSDDEEVLALVALTASPNVHLIRNQDNLGVAAALNQGMKWADERGYRWLLALDQDSLVCEYMVEELIRVYRSCSTERRVAVIGSNFMDRDVGQPLISTPDAGPGEWIDAKAVITAGSLISIEAAERIGPFRDEFFIDQVDFEYCLRARAKQLSVVISSRPLMEHGISVPRECRLLGKRFFAPNTPPERHYYATRNQLALVREYAFREPAWVFASVRARLKEVLLMLFCERDRFAKALMIARGCADAVLTRMGRLE